MKHRFTAAFCAVALGITGIALTQTEGEAKGLSSFFDTVDVRAIEWEDLTPPRSAAAEQAIAELNARIDQMTDIEVDEALATINAEGSELIMELNDLDVEIEGFLVPMDFDAQTVTDFVLVPWFGACIHVPPPPPNQIVFVRYDEGIAMQDIEDDLYTRFKVTGRLKAAPTTTALAQVGYQLSASDIVSNREKVLFE